jgi:ABC-type sugar transport system ATPase subunit
MSELTPRVEVEGLVKSFGAVQALKGITARIRPGEVVGLIGANGAGKSSLVRALAGASRPDEGEIRVDGESVSFRSPRDAIAAGIVLDPQELSLVLTQSIAENVFIGALPARGGIVDRRSSRARARALLEEVGLGHRDPSEPAASLTPVESRLVSIASALSKDPRLLILDEPSAALPVETAERLAPIIAGLARRGCSVIYISHRLGEVQAYCDRVLAMRDGLLAGELVGDEIQERRMVELVGGKALDEEPPPSASDDRSGAVTVRASGLTGARVQDVDLEASAGEILGIGGLYGSGRSELLRLIGGMQAVAAGTVEVSGRPGPRSPRQARQARIGYLAEGRKRMIFPQMSVTANGTVALLSRLNPFLLRIRRERALMQEMGEQVGLVGGLDAPISTLSGGNQQKVCLARWLLCDVELLLLDEPTVGVDVHARAEIHGLLRDLAAKGRTIIVASAEPEELALLCDRVVVLAEGRVNRELRAPLTPDAVVAASYAAA